MRKLCTIILFSLFITHSTRGLPQKIWSRPIRNSQGQLVRERRQFPFGDWIPLNQQCPTCRPLVDSLDVGLRGDSIGLTPPKPPTTRQIHGEGNFFPQDESSILSVPPPPPSAIPRHPITNSNGNFQFSNFAQQFNSPLPVPTQQIFPQTQQISFLPQTFLQNQQLLVNNNQQILSSLNGQSNVFGQSGQSNQQITNGKLPKFNSEFKTENVVLEQNKRPQPFFNKPTPFSLPQQQQKQQQQFGIQQSQQQSFGFNKQQNGLKIGDSILTPPPAPTNVSQDVVIPGLGKEEIQLLYVPVETLRQRGNFQQQQLLSQQQQNIQFNNRPSPSPLSPSTFPPTEPSTTKIPKGHFVTQNDIPQGSLSTLKVTPSQPFSTSVTPSPLLFQQLPFQQTPQPFVSATPSTPTTQNFVTPSPASQKFSAFTPETTLSHLATIPNNIQFSQSDFGFSTTPNTILNHELLSNQFINEKSQFSDFKGSTFPQQQQKQEVLQQSFGGQQGLELNSQQNSEIFQNQQRPVEIQNQQINQQQIALQKQQEQQRLLQQQKEKDLQEQILLKQQQEKEIEAQRLLQQQKEKELEEQRLVQLRRQKELEEQRRLQEQEKLEQQRILQQQKQKELEQQRRQKELEEQRLLQQQRQKELEEQRFLQQQRQKELEQQRYLQQQREKELENQRRLQLQRQKELEEKRRLQAIKQKEEEQRLYRLQQQQQRELEEKRLYKLQQEEQQRLLLERQKQEEQRLLLERQKQENLKKQTQIPFYQQQVTQQQFTQQGVNQENRHKLPANDHLNSISQLEKESEPEGNQLVPHQPPLSVFYKGQEGAEARITDVLKELRSSNRITVLDQYFEKMPKVFVGPAGLNPPVGYGKFELPYLSNIENNRIERKIDRLPFFVAPLNFVPPPGYAKIPFPAPHVGSVVVSSESNPAMKTQQGEKGNNVGFSEGNDSESFSMVGPELPGLINSLQTETTTLKPITFPSTPSLPQTTAQLRNRRPNNNVYKTQTRKPITRTRYQTTTIKPEEEVTQPIQKIEVSKDTDTGFRKPFNRFLNRRRQQTKTTTESPIRNQQDSKNLENRHYSVEVYHQQKNTNSIPKSQLNTLGFQEQKLNFQAGIGSIDRSTPGGLEVYEVSSTPGFPETGSSIETDGNKSDLSDYADVNLQSFEDGPLPTGSAKTITQELYRPNIIQNNNEQSKDQPKLENVQESKQTQYTSYEEQGTSKYGGVSEVNPTAAIISSTSQETKVSEELFSAQPNPTVGFDQQSTPEEPSGKYYPTELPRTEYTPISITVSPQQPTKGYTPSDVQYTQAFADISKHHHFPVPTSVYKKEQQQQQQQQYNQDSPLPTPDITLQTPLSQEQHSQEFLTSGNIKTQNVEYQNSKFLPTASSNEQFVSEFNEAPKNEKGNQASEVSSSQVSPTAPGSVQDQYTTGFSLNSESYETSQRAEEERRPSFIGFHDVPSSSEVPPPPSPQPQYYPSSTVLPKEHIEVTEINKYGSQGKISEETYGSFTEQPKLEVSDHPSTPAFKLVSEDAVQINDEKHTTEGQDDNLSGGHRLKLPNPSIVRVRTRGRGKPRGQINFASSQSTTQAPIIRSKVENKNIDHADQELSTKTSSGRDYQPVKTQKYNTYRGLKKSVRTTTEPAATTEHEQKVNVYTIRPQRRPSNPSTVSTKRIRRPTTPISTVETATESFGISTARPYYHQSDNGELSPSGFSNDVYFEHTSLTPVRQKFRKHFGSAEHKSDVVPVYSSTPFPSTTAQIQLSTHFTEEEVSPGKDLSHSVVVEQEHSETYPEWNPSDSGIDVSGIVLTTLKSTSIEEQQEVEEPKKSQDSKKAFDPDLEKKSGRRRVRVRVHKRPHENFETAESQNLRTVANVLVPPTSTYKPNDETNYHQLAKNTDFSFGGSKSYGARSREYFRKRLNLTQTENLENKEEDLVKAISSGDDAGEKSTRTKVLGFVRKIPHKTEHESAYAQSSEVSEDEGSKAYRTKPRGYVRKVIKHKGGSKVVQTESSHLADNEEVGEKEGEFIPRQNFRGHHEDSVQNGRLNGTRHRTIIRYIKKNKLRTHETESHSEVPSDDVQTEAKELKQSTQSAEPEQQQINEVPTTLKQTYEPEIQVSTESLRPVYQSTQESETKQTVEVETQKPENSEEKNAEVSNKEQYEVKETTQSLIQTTQEPLIQEENESSSVSSEVKSSELQTQTSESSQTSEISKTSEFSQTRQPGIGQVFRNSFSSFRQHSSKSPEAVTSEAPSTQDQGLVLTQKPKFNQNLRPAFQRPTYTGFQRSRDSTTERNQEIQEKRDGPLRPKYGKTSSYSTTEAEEVKRVNDFQTEQQIKNKNLHTLEVRKYLRTKSREGAFSSFSKNRYYTSEKTQTVSTTKEESTTAEHEESTTPFEETTLAKKEETTVLETRPETTQSFVASTITTEGQVGTTKLDEEAATTEKILHSSEEENSTEESGSESESEGESESGSESEETSSSSEATTEVKTEVPNTSFHTVASETIETTTESKTEEETTTQKIIETQPDLYRFSKSSFSFDEAEKFTGTQNRAHVRNITADIIENTATFSAPGVEKKIVSLSNEEQLPQTTEFSSGVTRIVKTEETTTEPNDVETTTEYQEKVETETAPATEPVTKPKVTKLIKTSTQTKISHETEICYKGKCIRTKSENPDDDLKLLVDSASTTKIQNLTT